MNAKKNDIETDNCSKNINDIKNRYNKNNRNNRKLKQLASTNKLPSNLTLSKVRWATLGYQYNWTERSYTPDQFVSFPEQLGLLAEHLAESCGVSYTIKPEAGIVNFYPEGQGST